MDKTSLLLLAFVALGCGSGDSSGNTGSADAVDDTNVADTLVASDARDAADGSDAGDASDVLADTTPSDGSDASDASGSACGTSTCTSTEWCVIPCCTGAGCAPPPRYCTPGGCSGSGCDSLCFGRTSVPDATKKTVTCMCP